MKAISYRCQTPPPKGGGWEEVDYANFYSTRTGLNPETTKHLFDSDIWMILLNKRPLSSGEGWGEVNKLLYGFFCTAFFLLAAQLQAQTVYISKTGARFHKESCRYAKIGWTSDLATAKKKGLTACLVCKPSSIEAGESNHLPLSAGSSKTEPVKETKPAHTTSAQCKATTKAGSRCSRKSAAGRRYCWQHDG